VYDADGKRVKRNVGTASETWMVYGIDGELIAEYAAPNGVHPTPASPTTEYAYRLGEMLIQADASDCKWLVSDHLGSPRIILGKSGSLADTKRRDFMPFGEDLGAGQFGRTTALGYEAAGTPSNPREKFATYERDDETGLDFAQARYYQNRLGRFTSVDPLLSSGEIQVPQTWNRYAYSLNNPLLYTDPSGFFVYGKNVNDEQKKQFEVALKQAKEYLSKIADEYGKNSSEYKKVERSLSAYGNSGEDNGVVVTASDRVGAGQTTLDRKTITVAFNPNQFGNESSLVPLIGHEGSHVADAQKYLATGENPSNYQFEYDGHFVQSVLGEAIAKQGNFVNYYVSTGGTQTTPERKVDLWNKGWEEADKATLRSNAINEFLAISKKDGGSYQLSPGDKDKTFGIQTKRKRK
jgi:RHS repeat-associated protein